MKHLDKMSDYEITGLNIPTGVPLAYELDEELCPIRKYYLGDIEQIQKSMQEAADQGKVKE